MVIGIEKLHSGHVVGKPEAIGLVGVISLDFTHCPSPGVCVRAPVLVLAVERSPQHHPFER